MLRLKEINANITEISDSIDQFNQRIEGFENVSELESTINQINNRITANTDLLNSLINVLNNFTQTPAIFDTDVNADDIPDTRSDEFTNNSLWFIEENNGE